MGILDIIKQASKDTIESTQPAAFVFGVVTKTAPLTVSVEGRLTISEPLLIIPETLRTYRIHNVTGVLHGTINFSGSISTLDHNVFQLRPSTLEGTIVSGALNLSEITLEGGIESDPFIVKKAKIDPLGEADQEITGAIDPSTVKLKTTDGTENAKIDSGSLSMTAVTTDGSAVSHNVGLSGGVMETTFTVKSGELFLTRIFNVGDELLLARVQGGQRYVVLERLKEKR